MNRVRMFIAVFVMMSALFAANCFAGNVEASPDALAGKGFEPAAENNNLILYMNAADGQFVVENKRSGERWWSNPEKKDEDELAKGVQKMQLSSQLLVTYATSKGDASTVNNFVSSTNEKGAAIEKTKRGFKAVYHFPKQKFTIPVEYTLENDHLIADIVISEIEEQDPESMITLIGFLPYFGAGSTADSGYMLVPDGSGALINFNNGKAGYETYRQKIYDNDNVLTQTQEIISRQRASLPVFGLKNGSQAFIAVVDQGDALGTIRASVSGTGTSYNQVYSEFTYRQLDTVKLLSRTWAAKDVRLLANTASQLERVSLHFYFLTGDDSNYSGMASRYQQYLIEEKGLRKTAMAGQVPLFLDLYGAAAKQKTFLGLPFTSMEALTTYAQAEKITEQLLEADIEHIVLQYKGWANEGLTNNKLPASVKAISKLGGEAGFKRLLSYMDRQRITFYPAVDMMYFRSSGNGFSSRSDVASAVTKLAAPQYAFLRSTYQIDSKVKPQYLLSPLKMPEAIRKFMKSYAQFSFPQLALNELGSQIYSDYRKGGVDRGAAVNIWKDVFEGFKDKEYSILLQQPNGYALPFASHAAQLPIESSRFDIEDESVPFYQMVLHGIIPYSIPAVNVSSDPETMLLKAVETGSSLQYSWMYAAASLLKGTPYSHLYSIRYQDWIDSAISSYKKLFQALYKVADKRITGHSQLRQGVYETEYENGIRIIVNYNEVNAAVEGKTVEARGYLVVDGADKK
ncbi:DUF5696 domain-containing protein [Paenibacillus sp. IITD108]|uniref:DUF5696 domain-containing protein n=1 Tax=Paenibacillus sp. IITD108 TaxID=3116649 RepID=UPI002F40BB49